jgi:hypothetical protein
MRSSRRALLSTVLVLSAAACSNPASGSARQVGIVQWAPSASTYAASAGASDAPLQQASITAPDTVQAGVAFTATIGTIGLSGCWHADGAELHQDGSVAEVTPFDVDEMADGHFCTAALVALSHPVSLTFVGRGDAIVRVRGRRVFGYDPSESTAVIVEKHVFVR